MSRPHARKPRLFRLEIRGKDWISILGLCIGIGLLGSCSRPPVPQGSQGTASPLSVSKPGDLSGGSPSASLAVGPAGTSNTPGEGHTPAPDSRFWWLTARNSPLALRALANDTVLITGRAGSLGEVPLAVCEGAQDCRSLDSAWLAGFPNRIPVDLMGLAGSWPEPLWLSRAAHGGTEVAERKGGTWQSVNGVARGWRVYYRLLTSWRGRVMGLAEYEAQGQPTGNPPRGEIVEVDAPHTARLRVTEDFGTAALNSLAGGDLFFFGIAEDAFVVRFGAQGQRQVHRFTVPTCQLNGSQPAMIDVAPTENLWVGGQVHTCLNGHRGFAAHQQGGTWIASTFADPVRALSAIPGTTRAWVGADSGLFEGQADGTWKPVDLPQGRRCRVQSLYSRNSEDTLVAAQCDQTWRVARSRKPVAELNLSWAENPTPASNLGL